MRFRKLSPSASYWFNRSWQTCILCSLCFCVSIRGTHLAQTLWYSNIAIIVSNALKLIFSSIHSFLVVICRFGHMSWWRCSSFHGVTAVHGRPEHGLSFMSLSPLLKRATHCLTVLTSTVWSPYTFSKCRWMSLGAIFSTWRNSVTHLCFIHPSMSDAVLWDCPSAVICHMATKFDGILVGKFNLYCHITNICLWCRGPT